MSTVLALNNDAASSNGRPTRVCNDAWHNNELADEVTLELSKHSRVLRAVNLHLEVRDLVPLKEVL